MFQRCISLGIWVACVTASNCLGRITTFSSSENIKQQTFLKGNKQWCTTIILIRGGPFLRMVFLICTMCKFRIMQIQTDPKIPTHPSICTNAIKKLSLCNLHDWYFSKGKQSWSASRRPNIKFNPVCSLPCCIVKMLLECRKSPEMQGFDILWRARLTLP